jgi:acyl-CoA reductase-like NAD-dependent aldehyde dehydrogenase
MTGAAVALDRGEMLIDGAPVAGTERFEVRDPGKVSDVVATVALGTPQDVAAAAGAAQRAFAVWGSRDAAERVAVLTEAVSAVEQRAAELAPVLSRENGGVLAESQLDLARGAGLFRNLVGLAGPFLRPEVTDNDQHWLSVERTPVGVTALIVPWNSPVVLTMSKLAPALAAGNTVVVKPSVYAPLVLGECLRQIAGFLPPGVLNVVHGDAEVGSALVTQRGVRKVSFTGSVHVGRQIMAASAATIKNVSLELGGNDAAIILDDADLPGLMPQLCRGIFTRAGQICFAVKRVYVPRRRYEDFYEQMCTVADSYRVGHGLDPQTTFGPLITAAARDRVRALIERARASGATVRELGAATGSVDWADGYYLLPAVARDLGPDAELVHVEQFGPVVPLVPYQTEDEAVAYANDSEFGLCSSVWSADAGRATRVARRIEAGVTFINSHNLPSLSFDVPFGGVKQSGLGRERTEAGLREYVEEHAIRLVK